MLGDLALFVAIVTVILLPAIINLLSFRRCPSCEGEGHNVYGVTCGTCGGRGRI